MKRVRLFDNESSLVIGTQFSFADDGEILLQLSYTYFQLADQLAGLGDAERSRRARDGGRRIVSVVTRSVSDRPALVLLKASALADQGEWDRARGLVRSLISEKPKIKEVSDEERRMFDARLSEWIYRELRHWESSMASADRQGDTLDQTVEEALSLYADLCRAVGREWSLSPGMSRALRFYHPSLAAMHRKAGKLDEAERTTERFHTLARQLVRDFPENPLAHIVLSDAFVQESKNAWKRNDLAAIKPSAGPVH